MNWKYIKLLNDKYLINEEGTVIALDWKLCGKVRTVPHFLNHKGYAMVSVWNGNKQVKYAVHRLVASEFLGSITDKMIDHIDRDITNNHYTNLRFCTLTENNRNRVIKSDTMRGVCKRRGGYVAHIKANKKTYYLGDFKTEVEAAKAYNKKAMELHKEFAVINILH